MLPPLRRIWSNLPIPQKGLIVAAVPILILVIGYVSSSRHAVQESNSRAWVNHSETVRWNLQALHLDFFAMESAARGFALDRDEKFRRQFADNKGDALSRLAKNEALVADSPRQHARAVELRELGLTKMAAMEELIAAAAAATLPGELVSLARRAAAAMEPVAQCLAAMENEEDRLERLRATQMREDKKKGEELTSRTPAWTVLGVVVSLSIFTYSVRRRIKTLRKNAAAMRLEAPLEPCEPILDEIGQVQSEMERTSEVIAERTERLRASDSEMRAILDNTSAIVYIKDLESRFVLFNRGYEQAMGITRAQALGKRPAELFGKVAGDAIRANDLAVLQSGKPGQFEETFQGAAGKRIYLSVKVPLFDPEGVIYGICGVSSDVTEMKSASLEANQSLEERLTDLAGQLREADESRHELPQPLATLDPVTVTSGGAIGDVAGKIAHDFNNILTAIIGYSSLLTDRENSQPADRAVAGILQASHRAARLTGQLLVMSRLAKLRVVEADEMLVDAAETLRELVGATGKLEIAPSKGLGRIKADPAQIEQVLLNLVVNAREATPTGTIRLQANRVSLPSGEGRTHAGDFISISVRDDGPGIPAVAQQRMYEPFYSTKPPEEGAGLGLAISTIFAQQNGGWLACKSDLHGGTTFTLYLPVVDLPLSPPPVAPHVALSPTRGDERVLVVDDEPAVAQLLAALLRHLGYKPIIAEDGEAAERLLAELNGGIDLVLTDEQMPRVGGWELIRRLRESRPGLKVIMVSGTDHRSEPTGDRAQPVDFLSKPFAMSELAEKVRHALDS